MRELQPASAELTNKLIYQHYISLQVLCFGHVTNWWQRWDLFVAQDFRHFSDLKLWKNNFWNFCVTLAAEGSQNGLSLRAFGD